MNRNNFFRKFAHFYRQNLKGIKENAGDVFDCLIDFVKDSLFDFIHLIIRIVSIFVPVIPVIMAFLTEYLDNAAVERESERIGIKLSGEGYYMNRKTREKQAESYSEQKKEFIKRQKFAGIRN